MAHDVVITNGTVVDGHRVKEAPLLPDAEFTVGPITFRAIYQYSGDTDSFASPDHNADGTPAAVTVAPTETVSPGELALLQTFAN